MSSDDITQCFNFIQELKQKWDGFYVTCCHEINDQNKIIAINVIDALALRIFSLSEDILKLSPETTLITFYTLNRALIEALADIGFLINHPEKFKAYMKYDSKCISSHLEIRHRILKNYYRQPSEENYHRDVFDECIRFLDDLCVYDKNNGINFNKSARNFEAVLEQARKTSFQNLNQTFLDLLKKIYSSIHEPFLANDSRKMSFSEKLIEINFKELIENHQDCIDDLKKLWRIGNAATHPSSIFTGRAIIQKIKDSARIHEDFLCILPLLLKLLEKFSSSILTESPHVT